MDLLSDYVARGRAKLNKETGFPASAEPGEIMAGAIDEETGDSLITTGAVTEVLRAAGVPRKPGDIKEILKKVGIVSEQKRVFGGMNAVTAYRILAARWTGEPEDDDQ